MIRDQDNKSIQTILGGNETPINMSLANWFFFLHKTVTLLVLNTKDCNINEIITLKLFLVSLVFCLNYSTDQLSTTPK